MECPRCHKIFRDKYILNRHINKKNLCREKEEEKEIEKEKIEQQEQYKCQYCCKLFDNKYVKIRHEESCKLKYDPVRILEMELNIKLDKYYDKECRFCDKTFTRQCNLTNHYLICKNRTEYINSLNRSISKKNNEELLDKIKEIIKPGRIQYMAKYEMQNMISKLRAIVFDKN